MADDQLMFSKSGLKDSQLCVAALADELSLFIHQHPPAVVFKTPFKDNCSFFPNAAQRLYGIDIEILNRHTCNDKLVKLAKFVEGIEYC